MHALSPFLIFFRSMLPLLIQSTTGRIDMGYMLPMGLSTAKILEHNIVWDKVNENIRNRMERKIKKERK